MKSAYADFVDTTPGSAGIVPRAAGMTGVDLPRGGLVGNRAARCRDDGRRSAGRRAGRQSCRALQG